MSGLQIHHKKNFHLMRWMLAILLVIIGILYVYFGVRWYNTGEVSPLPLPVAAANSGLDETPVLAKQIESHTAKSNEPRILEIPALGLEAVRITKIGVTDRHLLDTPSNIHDAGWYTKSATPGSGVAAVVLHANKGSATQDGVFAKLDSLKPSDQIIIERGDGKVFTYEVTDVREKPFLWVSQQGMKEMMYSADPSKEGLSIIVDSGKWIPKHKVYDHKILVRATLVE